MSTDKTQDSGLIELADRVEAGHIKALSIKQPYPHHIFHDGKDVENRDWPTKPSNRSRRRAEGGVVA